MTTGLELVSDLEIQEITIYRKEFAFAGATTGSA